MNNVPRFSEVLEGYLDLASQLQQNWTPFLNGVAAKLETGTYQAAEAKHDFPTGAQLVAESWMLIGSEAVDALAILTKDFSEQEKITGYHTDAAKAGTHRKLALKGDLKSVTGMDLSADRVTVVPATLGPTATAFTLYVDGEGLKARTYDGYVVATSTQPNGGSEEIFVSVTIG